MLRWYVCLRIVMVLLAWHGVAAGDGDGVRKELDGKLAGVKVESLRAAIVDLRNTYGEAYPQGDKWLGQLRKQARALPGVERALADGGARALKTAEKKIEKMIALQRAALLANPAVCGQPILFVVHKQYKSDHHNTATLFQTGEINTASFEGGSALKYIDLALDGEVVTLLECSEGVIRDPDVHFSGTKILFSMRHNIKDDYHIYEINVDGTGLRPLTNAQGISDIDPIYLPDDTIVFSSTREPKYCMCNRHIMANLFRMDADGANIHQIGKSTLFEGHGSLTPDGRILYSRWEYIDRNFGDAQGLWTVYPDGTNHAVYWGNNTRSPGAVLNAFEIPGTQQALCVFGTCHDRPWGALAIIDRRLALDGADALVRIWPANARQWVTETGKSDFNFDTLKQVNPKYEDPWPLNDTYFLCSRMTGKGEQMGIYLLDVFGNEILVHVEDPGCFDPMPLAPRTRPPAIPSRRDFENGEGSFYVADVYRGTHMAGVERGAVKYLRVVESPEKRFWTTPPWGGQGQEAPAMGWHDFNNKRILGNVPVEDDGSAHFSVPADRFVYFQLLDENGMMIQSMRSGTMIQSGEQQGCVGCHEERRTAAPVSEEYTLTALSREPSPLEGWYGPARFFNYMKEVQPVFDTHCVRCHDYGEPAGAKLVLAPDRDLVFNASYDELWRKKYIASIGAGPAATQQAYSWGSHASKLVDVIRKGHKNVELAPESFDRIVTWIDINGPYYPKYDSAYPDNLAGRAPLDNEQIERLSKLTGAPLAEQAGFNKKLGPQISFDRPEMSPCLAKLAEVKGPEYDEALAIIRAGHETLIANPRADMDGFEACPVDQRREEKYVRRLEIEMQNREALRNQAKIYDEGILAQE